jgi:hypothetical protein
MAKNRSKPNHTTFYVGTKVLVTFHNGGVLVDKTHGQFSHAKHLELKHYGKVPWSKIRAAVRFNPLDHLPLLQEQKQILSKDGYSIPLEAFETNNLEVTDVIHKMMADNAVKGNDEMSRRKRAHKLTDETWRQHAADLHVPVKELHKKLQLAKSTTFAMRAVLEGRKAVGWKNMHPPADVIEGIPYHPLAVNVRSEVGNEVSEIANAANAENMKAPVTVTQGEHRTPFTSADIRRVAGLLDKPAEEIAKIMGKKTNTIYVWLRLLKGEMEMGERRYQRIPADIVSRMPLTEPYRISDGAPDTTPSANGHTARAEKPLTSLPTATGQSSPTPTPAAQNKVSNPRSLIEMIDALSEKFLAAASDLAEKKVALEALLNMEEQRDKTVDLMKEFDQLTKSIAGVVGS